MKETEAKKCLINLDTDTSMDQRIVENLLSYEAEKSSFSRSIWSFVPSVKQSKRIFKLSKVAVALVIISIISTTAVASNYFLRSYYAEHEFINAPESDVSSEKIIQIGEGHKYESTTMRDADGNVTEYIYPDDPNQEDEKYGEEAFAELGLPNLTPTYLYDSYLVDESGYRLIETTFNNGTVRKTINVSFFSFNTGKRVYLQFFPQKNSTHDSKISLSQQYFSEDDVIFRTYTTKNGLICNIAEDIRNDNISAQIYFDSELLGNGFIALHFNSVAEEEIEAILDSIPLSESTE